MTPTHPNFLWSLCISDYYYYYIFFASSGMWLTVISCLALLHIAFETSHECNDRACLFQGSFAENLTFLLEALKKGQYFSIGSGAIVSTPFP